MPNDTNSELVEVLGNLREHAKFLKELGVEHLALESSPEARTFSIPVVAAAAPAPVQIAAEPQPSKPHALPAKSSAPRTASMFAKIKSVEPALATSNETLDQIWTEIGDCTRCGLCEGRTQVVNTHGNRKARLMFVGEAPGADEDAQGKPFVGRAGQLLTKMIEAMGVKRDDVIIGNVNRCRPPGNRQPTLEEAAICRPFLFREIASIQPEIIVVMGNTALRNLLEVREGITRVRGIFRDFRGIKVMPTFHPAYLLRDPSKKRETWEDLKMVRDYLDGNPPISKP
jgi:uracil-DNA glycosylase